MRIQWATKFNYVWRKSIYFHFLCEPISLCLNIHKNNNYLFFIKKTEKLTSCHVHVIVHGVRFFKKVVLKKKFFTKNLIFKNNWFKIKFFFKKNFFLKIDLSKVDFFKNWLKYWFYKKQDFSKYWFFWCVKLAPLPKVRCKRKYLHISKGLHLHLPKTQLVTQPPPKRGISTRI